MTMKDLKRGDYFYYKNRLFLKIQDVYAGDKLRTYNAVSLNKEEGHGYVVSFMENEQVVLAENIL
jgi:hypothetical protein